MKKQDFKKFKKYCNYWIDKLGLTEWHFYFEFKETRKDKSASAISDITARVATITLNSKIDSTKDEDLNKIALEEIGHILLANISYYAGQYFKEDIVTEEEHVILNHLKKALTK